MENNVDTSESNISIRGTARSEVWCCDVTTNPIGTDTEMVGASCACQACRMSGEIVRLQDALEEVANPLAAIIRRAKAEGATLNTPMALQIANDPYHLRRVAADALKARTVVRA